ncbi:MAG: hypothetical protein JWO82_1901 [Akkermansiaceae bacterium]|nr:hypothetical protein [Akkermansiaceae bacterium]
MDEDAFLADLIAAVEQQLVSPQTRYVAKAYERLVGKGMAEADAKELIAGALGEETDAMYRRKTGFDEKSYKERLIALQPEDLGEFGEESEEEKPEAGGQDETAQ